MTHEIEKAIGKKTATSAVMESRINTWNEIYMGSDKGLHLASGICSELSRLIFAESQLTVDDKYLQGCLEDFLPRLIQDIEIGLALGGMAIKPYYSKGKVHFDLIPIDRMFPVAFEDGLLYECVFADTYTEGSTYYTRLEHHVFSPEAQTVTISNYTFKSSTKGTPGFPCELTESPWCDIEPVTEISSPSPLFGFFRVPRYNGIDRDSPLGVSVFDEAIPQIVQADKLWNDILWEYSSKKAKIFATEDLLDPFSKTKGIDANVFVKLAHSDAEASITPYSPEIRDSSYFSGLNKIIQRIEFSCRLAYGTISEPTEIEKTATEIKASKQRSYVFVSALQTQMEAALRDALSAAKTIAVYHGLTVGGTVRFTADWGDSVLEDTEAKYQRELMFVQQGILKPELFLMEYYGCDEETAKSMIPEKQSQDFSLFGGDR